MPTKLQRTPVAVTLGGVTVKTFRTHYEGHTDGHITIPTSAVKRILRNGNVWVMRDHRYTDDYAWDAATDFGRAAYPAETLADEINGTGWHAYYRAAWQDAMGRDRPATIEVGCYHFLGYSIRPASGEIEITNR